MEWWAQVAKKLTPSSLRPASLDFDPPLMGGLKPLVADPDFVPHNPDCDPHDPDCIPRNPDFVGAGGVFGHPKGAGGQVGSNGSEGN